MKTVGEIIKEKRIERGWSIKLLSQKLGIAGSAVRYWEKNKFMPSLLSACDLADLFHCTLDELCGRDPTKITVKESKYEKYKQYFT